MPALSCRAVNSEFLPLATHLSRVKRLHGVSLHEEHVDEVDEHTGSMLGVPGSEDDPLVENHEDEVAKETQQKEQLREEDQVEAVLLPKVPVGVGRPRRRLHSKEPSETRRVEGYSGCDGVLLACNCKC